MSSKPKQTVTSTTGDTKAQGQQSSSSSSNSTRDPWSVAKPYFSGLYNKGANAVDLVNNKTYGGDFVAPATTGQRQGVQSLYDAAPGLSTGSGELRDMGTRIASGEFLDPNNPVLRAAIDSNTNAARLSLLNDTIPQVTDAAIRGGAYGGTANALLKNKALEDFSRGALDSSNNATLSWMNNRFGDLAMAPNLLGAGNTLALAPGMAFTQAGDLERGYNQLDNDNAIAQYQNEIEAPWYGLQNFVNLLTAGGYGTQTGSSSSTGTSTQTGGSQTNQVYTGAEPDMMTQILQAGLGGLGVHGSLGQAFPQTMSALGSGSVMAPIMAGLTALSERGRKVKAVPLYELRPGIMVYAYRYTNLPDMPVIGCMVDEVEEVVPAAIVWRNGKKHINYARLR